MSSNFATQRSISQIIRRHTPGSLVYLDEHNLHGRVTYIAGEPAQDVDKDHLHKRFLQFLKQWKRDGKLYGIDDNIGVDDITAITPDAVYWEPYPPLYRCSNSNCQVLHDGRDAVNFTNECRRCGSELRQMQFVYYHHCGELGYLRPPGNLKCPTHGKSFLYFYDTGSYFTSKWRCRECNYEKDFYFPPCGNPTCKAEKSGKPFLQGSFWNDQWVHYCQTLDYINMDERLTERFLRVVRGKNLLLRGVLGEVPAGNKRLQQMLEQEGITCPNCQATDIPVGSRFCNYCGQLLPDGLYDNSEESALAKYEISSSSPRCVWALLRDMEGSRSLRNVAQEQEDEGEGRPQTNPYRWGLKQANAAGIADVILVTNFPLTTAAVGYTRYQSGPPTAWLRPFPRVGKKDERQRYPLYTHSVETEAWLVQLQAKVIAQWIIDNNWQPWAAHLSELIEDVDETMLKEWFMEQLIPIQEQLPTASTEDAQLYHRVQALLHSFSHITLLALALHSGIDATSLGEILMTDALGFAIYTGSSDLGAMTAAFRQITGIVFNSVIEDYASCKFDPLCRYDDGGACVGCVQLYRGCQLFNSNLSRAFLYGGPTGDIAPGEVKVGFFTAAQ